VARVDWGMIWNAMAREAINPTAYPAMYFYCQLPRQLDTHLDRTPALDTFLAKGQ